MSRVSAPFKRQGLANVRSLWVLLGSFIAGVILFVAMTIAVMVVFKLPSPQIDLVQQCLFGLLCFGMPASLTDYYYYRTTGTHMFQWCYPQLQRRHLGQVLLLFVPMVIISGVFAVIMQSIPAPWDWLRALEESAATVMKTLLAAHDLLSNTLLFLSIVVIAPITEELLFRGVLQGWGLARTGRIHLSIWVAAVLFSMMHMEWSGFPSRLLMGAVLGYCAVYGGLKMSILLHALNNFYALIVLKIFGDVTDAEPSAVEWIFLLLFAIVAGAGIVYILQIMRNRIVMNNPINELNDEKKE